MDTRICQWVHVTVNDHNVMSVDKGMSVDTTGCQWVKRWVNDPTTPSVGTSGCQWKQEPVSEHTGMSVTQEDVSNHKNVSMTITRSMDTRFCQWTHVSQWAQGRVSGQDMSVVTKDYQWEQDLSVRTRTCKWVQDYVSARKSVSNP